MKEIYNDDFFISDSIEHIEKRFKLIVEILKSKIARQMAEKLEMEVKISSLEKQLQECL